MTKVQRIQPADHLVQARKNALVNGSLDRITHRRDDSKWFDRKLEDPTTLFVPIWNQKNLIDMQHMKAVKLTPQDVLSFEDVDNGIILLGNQNNRTFFAYLFDTENNPIVNDFAYANASFEDLRRFGPMLDDCDASLLAYAKAIGYWHQRHRFCGSCGSSTSVSKAGHLRSCTNPECGAIHFPRTDPAIIVLVHSEDHCLLGRQARWPKGVYSTIAGFVEPGESAEQAVLREVWEEAGIRIDKMSYQSSQPWPFPSSLMLGFQACAQLQKIRRNDNELEDAKWFSRDTVAEAVAGNSSLKLPPAFSVSRRLIEDWCK